MGSNKIVLMWPELYIFIDDDWEFFYEGTKWYKWVDYTPGNKDPEGWVEL